MSRPLDYRADLDGLRAVAVVPVILYHFGFSWVPGGFVGVDVFFVLSGFFITRQIVDGLARGRFTILEFYDRRIRRLLPALAAMLFASTVAALALLLPDDLKRFGAFAAAAALSSGNGAAWYSADYFGPDANTLPLLHTWSLAVEEQFYAFFPILLIFSWRYWRKYIPAVVTLVVVASFTLSIWATAAHPSAAFYGLPTRMWELGLGCLLAVSIVPPTAILWLRNAATATGLAGIAISVLTYSSKMPFPGLAAALPCLGCALVIWAGQTPNQAEGAKGASLCLMARPLTSRPVVLVGLISYSLYLWHWPLIVFSRYASIEQPSGRDQIILLLVIFAVAFASWRFIELPLRHGGAIWPSLWHRFTYAGGVVLAITVLGVLVNWSDGFPGRFPTGVVAMSQQAGDFSPVRKRCHAAGDGGEAFADTCVFGVPSGHQVVVLGDSHAAELGFALAEMVVKQNIGVRVRLITASGCPPALDFATRNKPNCSRHVEKMMAGISASPKSTVIVTAFFTEWDKPEYRRTFWPGFNRVLAELHKSGHKIILLGDVPPHPTSAIPEVLAKWVMLGRRAQDYAFDVDEAEMDRIDVRLRAMAKNYDGTYIPLMSYVCGHSGHCQAFSRDHAIYFDSDHISLTTAREIVRDLVLPSALHYRSTPGLSGTPQQ